MREIDKLNYRHKLEMLDELIAEFPENPSLWEVKNQIKAKLNEGGQEVKQNMSKFENMRPYPNERPREYKPCFVQTKKGFHRAYLYLAYDGWTWIDLDTDKPMVHSVLSWTYIND